MNSARTDDAATFVAYVGVRLRRRRPVSEDRRAHYTPVATSATVACLHGISCEVSGVDVEGDLERAGAAR